MFLAAPPAFPNFIVCSISTCWLTLQPAALTAWRNFHNYIGAANAAAPNQLATPSASYINPTPKPFLKPFFQLVCQQQ